jgi:hypothetical protein
MRFRSLLAALALTGAVACSDEKGPTAPELNNPGNTQTADLHQGLTFPVAGTLADGGTFDGNVTITEITRDGNQLLASGTLTGTATQGSTVTQITQNFTDVLIGITQQGRTCRILDLDLGPIHLDLLGLVVDLSEVELDITAQQGPGNLLGNLLCALVSLLDRNPLDLLAIDRLLDQINAIIG